MKNAKAKNSSILSVHSRRPYFFNNLPDCVMVPCVLSSSSCALSTLTDDCTRVSSVAALFCVVSDRCRDIDSIFSVTLSCWDTTPAFLTKPERCRTSVSDAEVDGASKSVRSCRSISSMVWMLALRNAWRLLENEASVKRRLMTSAII